MEKMECCFIASKRARFAECGAEAEFEILCPEPGKIPADCTTYACERHVGALIHTDYATVTRLSGGADDVSGGEDT